MSRMTRRQMLKATAAGSALAIVGTALPFRRTLAETRLTAAEWGGDVIDAMRQIASAQDAATFNWDMFSGGAGSILPKIKTAWPRVEYDYVAGWEGSFFSMIEEDWLESVSVDRIPNLADIPEKLIMADGEGNWKTVPRAVGGIYFGYRPDTAPMEITSLDDLLDPRLERAICWPGTSQNMMLQLVALALHNGGDEHNMDPGWEMMKEIARSGNIARVAVTDTDFVNSMTSGETSVGMFAEPAWATVAEHFELARLTKQEGIPTFLYQSGFAVLRNRPNTEATLDFINHAISPEMNGLYARVAGEAPLNTKAETPPELAHLTFTSDEMDRYVYVPDYSHVLAMQDAWAKRWEQEIAPLL